MFVLDALALTSLATFLLLCGVTWALAPKTNRASLLCLVAGTALAYIAGSPLVFAAGWVISLVPVWTGQATPAGAPKVLLALSALALAAGFLLQTAPHARPWAFSLLVLAAMLRKGIFPFHIWVPVAFEGGSLPLLNLVLNSHLGAFVLVRFGVPMFPELADQALSVIGVLAIFTAVYAGLLALVAARPRRILALLATSQASFILAGLENRNVEGITGALVHWLVVAFAMTALVGIYTALEARTTEVTRPAGYLGLGYHAPRLAVFFAIAAFALVGLPGTLGFAAEDLLFHGALESHPLLGVGLPLATALNAITAFRLFSTLFLGRRGIEVPPIPDALARERAGLLVPVLALVGGGLAPGLMIALRAPAAASLAQLLAGR